MLYMRAEAEIFYYVSNNTFILLPFPVKRHPHWSTPDLRMNQYGSLVCVIEKVNTKPTSSHTTARQETQEANWGSQSQWSTRFILLNLFPLEEDESLLPTLIWGPFIHSLNKYLLSAILIFYCFPNKLAQISWLKTT